MNPYEGIVITRLANGWAVTLPNTAKQNQANDGMITPDQIMQHIPKMMRAVTKGLQDDPTISDLQEKDKANEASKDTITVPSQANTYAFTTFAEVIGFLKYKIEE